MKKTTLIILATLIISGCVSQRGKQEFFPAGVFESRVDLNAFRVGWYSKHLTALGEEPLPPKMYDKKNEVYRFTCLRTFHNPFTIRIHAVAGGGGFLIRKVSSGQGGYDPGIINENVSTNLSSADVEALRNRVNEIGFRDLPTTEDMRGRRGMDGSRWFVEAVKDGRYHIVDRWTPEDVSEIRILGERFLSLARWRPKELY